MFHPRIRHGLVLEILARLFLFLFRGIQLVQDIVQMHLHVAGLDAFGGQRAHGGEVVGQTHCGGYHHQLFGGRIAQEFEGFLGKWVQTGQSANGTQSHRYLQFEVEDAIFNRGRGKALIMSVARGKGVSCRLHGTEVIARSNDNSVNTVVYTFVVCRGSIGVDVGDVDGFLEFFGVFGTREMLVDAILLLHRAYHPDLHATIRRVVRQYGHDDFHLAKFFGQVLLLSEKVL